MIKDASSNASGGVHHAVVGQVREHVAARIVRERTDDDAAGVGLDAHATLLEDRADDDLGSADGVDEDVGHRKVDVLDRDRRAPVLAARALVFGRQLRRAIAKLERVGARSSLGRGGVWVGGLRLRSDIERRHVAETELKLLPRLDVNSSAEPVSGNDWLQIPD